MNESEHSDMEMAKLMLLISEEKNGYREIELDNRKYLMVWSTANAGWSLIEFTPWVDIVSGAESVNRTIWIIGGIAIITALVMIRLLVTQFTHPIRVLIHLMNQYPYQKYQDDIPADYKNEFGSLFSGYRKLIVRIQELYAGLERQYLKQKEVEVKALQTMINPHFLYNTLDQINWTAIESEQKHVSKM
ncbi:sensor histidine kinase, partial [Mycobacterium tuberculosis]